MTAQSSYSLLLDLDALMDTRMGTLLVLDPELSTTLATDKYRTRDRDDFTTITEGRVTTEAFLERYAKRDLDVLRKSIVTGILPVLLTYVSSLEERLMRQVDVTGIRIDLNLWPYTLSGPLIEMYKNCLTAIVPPYVEIGTVSLSPNAITPEALNRSYNGWVTYHFHQWLEKHHETLLFKPINSVAVILPKLYQRELGEGGEVPEMPEEMKTADKHGLLELIMEDYIHLEHIPVSDFSFIVPGTYRLPEDHSSSENLAASDASTD